MHILLPLTIAIPLAGFGQSVPAKVPARLHQSDLCGALESSGVQNSAERRTFNEATRGGSSPGSRYFRRGLDRQPMQRYVDLLHDIESFERGRGFRVTKRIGSPPRLADFDLMQLPRADLTDLRSCEVGECEIKLGERALQRFRAEVDWGGPDWRDQANALFRQIAHGYVTAYLDGGNDRLAVYRDDDRPTFVAREFREL